MLVVWKSVMFLVCGANTIGTEVIIANRRLCHEGCTTIDRGSGWLGSAADGTAEALVMTSVELTVDYK